MPYLIDGHNVIGQMSGLRLDDPHDEAKLVLRLRSYSASLGKKFHVVFDGGVPAGMSRLSTSRVQVYFASADSSADNVLRMLIKNATNAPAWIVVTSDASVASVAQRKGMKVMRAERFAQKIEALEQAEAQVEKESYIPETKIDPRLSKTEIEEWLELFSDDE